MKLAGVDLDSLGFIRSVVLFVLHRVRKRPLGFLFYIGIFD